jgi:hypothetical protein
MLECFLVFLVDDFEILRQIFQILVNHLTVEWFALCEIEALNFKLAFMAAKQIDVLL